MVIAKTNGREQRTEPRDRPYQAFCTADQIARLFWMAAVALAAARAIAGGWSTAQPGQQRQGFLIAPLLDGGDGFSFSASVASCLNNRIAARASVKAASRPCWSHSRRAVDHRKHGSHHAS